MPLRNYKCDKCDFKKEYLEGANFAKKSQAPEICPECKTGKLIRDNSENFKIFCPPVPGTYQHNRRIAQIDNALMDPKSNHNTNPY